MLTERGLVWGETVVARLEPGRSLLEPRLRLDPALDRLAPALRDAVRTAVTAWFGGALDRGLAPLRRLADAAEAPESGPNLRAMLLRLVDGGGVIARDGSGLDRLDPRQREVLRRLGLRIGGIDLYLPAMLRPAALRLWLRLAAVRATGSNAPVAPPDALPATVPGRVVPVGYRRAGHAAVRVDLADRLLQDAHRCRLGASGRRVYLDPARAQSMGLSTAGYAALLRAGGFCVAMPRTLPDGAFGPHAPPLWDWRAPRPAPPPAAIAAVRPATGAFAALAELLR
jgi:ATP-dependent RNA helicase SUPV3L1/SUV3